MRSVVTRTAALVFLSTLSFASITAAEPFAYVVGVRSGGAGNRGVQVLSVIDIPSRTKVAAIPLGEGCLCVFENAAVSRDGTRVYVSNYWSNTVSVVDTATNTLVRTLNVQPFPASLAVSPDGARLYVNTVVLPNPGYVVQVVDTASGATITTIPLQVPQSGSGMAMAPDGSRLYVTNQALTGSNVKVIDTTSHTVVATVPTGNVPRGVDVTPDGQFAYVAVQDAGAVAVIATATNTVVATVPAGTMPSNVRVLPNGLRAYATADGIITVVATSTRTSVGSIAAFLPRAVDFTPDSATGVVTGDARVYVLDTATNTIVATIPFATATEGNPYALVIPQATPAPPEAPTDLAVTSIIGNSVTLRWRPAAAGSPPSGYLLEGGLNPGQVLAGIPTGNNAPAFTFNAPSGAFYIRMHATGAGGRSPASNEIHVYVNTPTPPSPPADLVGLVNGSSLALAWRNTFAGGAPLSLVLDVTGSTTTTVPLGLSEAFAFDPVPTGTYTFTVHAVNGAGASARSNPVSLTFPGPCSGAPPPPANFFAYRQGRSISVGWEPAAAGPAPTGYVLNVSGAFSANVPTTARALAGAVGPGTYVLSVAATNACGTSAATAAATIAVP